MKIIVFLAILTLSFHLTSCSPQTPLAQPEEAAVKEVQILSMDPKIKSGVLENGLKYFVRVNHKPENRAELRLVVNAGSVLEDDDQQGIAHLVEHMGFNGTEHFAKQELVDYVESIGMGFGPHLNAYTSFDETVYILRVPTDSAETVIKAFQILGDWAQRMTFDPNEIDKERGVVIEEWRRGLGAQARMRDKQFPILFHNSKYAARLPIGQKAVLDTASHETIVQFYRDWYRPDLMAVIAVGDFEDDEIERLIREQFSGLKNPEEPRQRTFYPVPDHEETLVALASDREATGSRVAVYYKQDVQSEETASAYRNRMLAGLYNRLLNSRLDELRLSADPPFLGGFSYQGRFIRTKEAYVLLAVVKDNGIERGLETLLVEAERVARHGFTPSELEREKKNVIRSMERAYQERDKTQSRVFASEYIRHFLEGEPIPGIEYELELYRRFLPGITLEEVNRLARHWLVNENRVIMVNLPEKEGVVSPADDELLAMFDVVEAADIVPYKDEISDAPLLAELPQAGHMVNEQSIPKLDVTQWELSNGVRVFLKTTDFKNDEILLRATSPGGYSLADDQNYIAASTAAAVVARGGVGPFDRIALGKYLAGKMVNVSPSISSLTEGFSASASPQDIKTMFQLIYAYFTSPRKDSTAYLSYKEQMRGWLENRSSTPEAAFRDTIQVTLSQHHFRTRPWTLEMLDEMDLQTSYSFFRERFADASDFTFFIIGNFDVEEIQPLVLQYLGGLPATNRIEMWRDVGIETPLGKIEKTVRRGMEPKSSTRMVFSGPFEWTPQNRYDLNAMVQVLRIKLREKIREDESGTYSIGVSASPAHYPDEEYSITIRFGSDPERAQELTKTILVQIDSLVNYGTTEKYLTKVKERQRRQRETGMKENGFWIRNISFYDYHEEALTSIIEYDGLIDSLTLDAIQAAARKYLTTENYVKIVLYPESMP